MLIYELLIEQVYLVFDLDGNELLDTKELALFLNQARRSSEHIIYHHISVAINILFMHISYKF